MPGQPVAPVFGILSIKEITDKEHWNTKGHYTHGAGDRDDTGLRCSAQAGL